MDFTKETSLRKTWGKLCNRHLSGVRGPDLQTNQKSDLSKSSTGKAIRDTILQGQSLTTSTSITSSGYKFELGFFTPGQEYSTTISYLGVWYKRVLKKTVVWVANRDYPFTDSAVVLTIAADGNLVIVVGRVSYMLSNISSSGNTSATLSDSGNLVLNDRRSGDILWQSFDYPTDTLLPGMKLACFSNCSCSAYTYDSSNGCSIWREELLNVKQLKDDDANGRDFFLKLAASEFLSEGKDSRIKRWKWIIVALALSMVLLAAVSFFYCMWRRKSQNKGEDLVLFDLGTSIGAVNCKLNEAGKSHSGKKKEADLPLFSFASVSAATDNFSDANKLGQGGFGPVYKGKLQKGHEVAVKRLSRKSGQGLEELQNEAMLTAKLQHKNLVRILGCCIEKDEKILIYEYMPNKSLDFFLFANALTDTILRGQLVTASTTITSSGNEFELGFFSPGNKNSRRSSYLGIWYKRVSKRTVVWVANRDHPLTDSSAVLTIAADGNLVIREGSFSYMLSNISSSGNTSATLWDSGNLVLNDRRSGDILWQSFDYPTDTLLPGMKVGHDKRNGKTWSMLAWKSKEDPGPGVFSFELDPQGTSQFFILKEFQKSEQRKGFQKYWTSGTWNGQVFTQIPEMAVNYIGYATYISNEDESYFNYSLKIPSATIRLMLDISGQLQVLSWDETVGEWNKIWARPRELGDVNGWKDLFLRISNVSLPANSIVLSQVRSVGDCESVCFSNCSCSAYTYDGSHGCSIWGIELLNVQLIHDDPEGRDFNLRLPASEFLSKCKVHLTPFADSRTKRWKWIILALAVPMALLATVSFFYCLWRRKLQNKGEDSGEDLMLFDIGTSTGAADCKCRSRTGKKKEVDLPLFSFASVSAATDDFSDANKLGEGGFGPVYKGKLVTGYEVAVKRLSRKSGQGLEELQNEAMLIAKLQHNNLVRLLGCCIEKDEKILIYENMPNKSLDFFLFGLYLPHT
ncbi:hypothetical protein RHMOL_Rhmol04G0031000 [Rhododendron molle]|uniref:Uncharacterized protein n=1 Tax=Rhododendron molle TaxID=49168 RepID=A0ACC0NWS9_RHOML|nr:hypothetical protein RHMOL_Rhmol04G0031000 [Rhododendron molle]